MQRRWKKERFITNFYIINTYIHTFTEKLHTPQRALLCLNYSSIRGLWDCWTWPEKQIYNWPAQPREFSPRDQVLLLNPRSACKFLAKWQGIRSTSRPIVTGGVIKETVSPWSRPFVVVPKPDGSLCLCCNFWKHNQASVFERQFALPILTTSTTWGRPQVWADDYPQEMPSEADQGTVPGVLLRLESPHTPGKVSGGPPRNRYVHFWGWQGTTDNLCLDSLL